MGVGLSVMASEFILMARAVCIEGLAVDPPPVATVAASTGSLTSLGKEAVSMSETTAGSQESRTSGAVSMSETTAGSQESSALPVPGQLVILTPGSGPEP